MSSNENWKWGLSGIYDSAPLSPAGSSIYNAPYRASSLTLLSALSSVPYAPAPELPSKWSAARLETIKSRINLRASRLDDRIDALAPARLMPQIEQVSIGSGKQMHLAVLFLDICKFSSWPSSNHEEQSKVLRVMNLFMAEMLNTIRDYQGTFEKNTGDGLMAYFGSTEASLADACKSAVTAAAEMAYVNDHVLTPLFHAMNLWEVKFRVGIDAGPITLAKVGIPHLAEQFVAVGSSANIACKIMRLLGDGGICIGNNVRDNLPRGWEQHTSQLGDTGFVYVKSNASYPAWELKHRLSKP